MNHYLEATSRIVRKLSMASVLTLAIVMNLGLFAMTAQESAQKKQGDRSVNENKNIKKATFAGGCFWCIEHPYDILDGVTATVAGYIGGDKSTADYQRVSSGRTGHREALQITYDSSVVSYEKLLYIFWRNIDPTDARGQFCDKGFQYSTAIYAHDSLQFKEATASKEVIAKKFRKKDIATDIVVVNASTFFPAEEYHQDYYIRNPKRYKLYRYACGRDKQLRKLWGDYAGGH